MKKYNSIHSKLWLFAISASILITIIIKSNLVAYQNAEPFTLEQIINLIEAVKESELINQIERNKINFELSFENGAKLGRAGASDKLIMAIKNNKLAVKPEIKIERFVRGSHISGSVKGIEPSNLTNYKIIVYVKTNIWYIHPFLESFATINSEGNWEIDTVDRPPSPTRIAVFLVGRDYRAPSTINRASEIDAVAEAFADYY